MRKERKNKIGGVGHMTSIKQKNIYYQLQYAQKSGVEIIKKMYYNPDSVCLSRNKKKIEMTLEVERKQQKKYI